MFVTPFASYFWYSTSCLGKYASQNVVNIHDTPSPPRNLVPRASPSFESGAFPTAPPPPEGEALGMRLPPLKKKLLELL